MPGLCASMVSGWSGQTIYNIYLLQIYNVAFTCFPIVVYAVMDLEFDKTEFLERPRLYRKGLKEYFLTWKRYFWSTLEAVIHGLLVFVVAYVVFDASLAKDGLTNDLRNDGNLCYASVVIVVTAKILFDSNTINILVVMAAVGSITAYFFFVYSMGLIVEFEIYDQLPEIHHFPQQYFAMFLLTFAIYPVSKFIYSMNRIATVSSDPNAQQKSLDNVKRDSDHLVSQASLSNNYYTGYAFSGEQGNVRSLTGM